MACIRLERGHEDQEPHIHLEGLTRDVNTAEYAIRSADPFMEEKTINKATVQSTKYKHNDLKRALSHIIHPTSIDFFSKWVYLSSSDFGR